MTAKQIAVLTAPRSALEISVVTEEESSLAEKALQQWEARWGASVRLRLVGAARDQKLARVIYNTRMGFTCMACKMGECAN